MKVYIVYSIPDYIGIDIEGIFANKDDALKFMDNFNSTDELAKKYDSCKWDWFEEEVLERCPDDGKAH